MPNAVLGAIVFLIGFDLIDVNGLRRIARRRRSEFVIALVTAVVVCAVGVEQGIILAIVVSILEVIRRHYQPKDYVVTFSPTGDEMFTAARPGHQSAPGLIIFRYDSDLFYANANRFVDDVDYSAGVALSGLLDFLAARQVTFAISGADTALDDTLRASDLADRIPSDRRFASLEEADDAFRRDPAPQP